MRSMTETRDGFTFFWRPDSPFSQWHPAAFEVEGRAFVCAEQFMMHGKAMLFCDDEIAAQILDVPDPRTHKALGRRVRGFDEKIWRRNREAIVMTGSRAKFTQNPELRAALVATAPTQLVEASPMDRIWGIGMAASNPDATDRTKWKGLNLLGQILTRLRDELIER
jgi:ribA/ribD-fused uncharacterized protein